MYLNKYNIMKFLKKLFIFLIVVILLGYIFVKYQVRDRYPKYRVYQNINTKNSGQIKAGFAAVSITPDIVDTWNDTDGNAKYEPKKGDSYNDSNGNGKFDAIWIAGFHNSRAANGVHDPLWARAVVFDDGSSRIVLVSIDAIGFFHDQVIEIRKRLPSELGVDYCMVASTHVHEAPDLMGIWGESMFKSGVNEAYMEQVINGAVRSVEMAVGQLEPVTLYFGKDENSAGNLVKDTRPPEVKDPGIYLIQAKRADGSNKGVLISWADHPETLWSKNLLLTSDFPHYVRKGIEDKLGGTCVYFNGAIGGLMTTHPSLPVVDPKTGKEISEPSFEKAEAQGMTVASIALSALENPLDSISTGKINLQAETFTVPFKNKMFRLAAVIGLLDRGMTGRWKVRSEMAAWTLGPASFLTIPGEIYPEIVNGGVEAPHGRDFDIKPQEVLSLRSKMQGNFKFVFGLANDELGYIIPKSEWDNKEPWMYDGKKEFYGEENSMGPETAPIIYQQADKLLSNLNP